MFTNIKKLVCITDAFDLWCWRRLLRVPWTARRSNQSILKEINSEYWKDCCSNWRSTTVATWCEEQTHWKRSWCWERLRAGEGEWQKMQWLDGITNSIDMHLSKLREIVKYREAWPASVHGFAKNRTWLNSRIPTRTLN